MKKFAFAVVFAVVAVAVPLSSSCGGGPKCKKVTCAPTCDVTKQFCDLTGTDPTCKDFVQCSPACKTDGTEFCNLLKGACEKLCSPACKTDGTEVCNNGTCGKIEGVCSPACGAGKYCDKGTCKDVPVCSPVCDATKGEACTN